MSMIKVEPKFDGSCGFTFITDTELEFQFVSEHQKDILDRFVCSRFKNVGKLNVHSLDDYVSLGKSSLQEKLEKIEGHKIHDFGQLEAENSWILWQMASEELAFTESTLSALAKLSNEMFDEYRKLEA